MNKIISDRHEIKYYINFAEYYSITGRLSGIFSMDRHSAGDGGYVVRSLYFDNKSNIDYFQKIGGIENRKKIRIRVYNYDLNPVKMEIKNKYNNIIKKETFIIKHTDIARIISGDYSVLLGYKNNAAVKIYRNFQMDFYRPVVLVDYRREAYTYDLNQIRITFDRDLKKAETGLNNIFAKREMSDVIDKRRIIMEIKFNNTLPAWIKKILQLSEFERCAISKYTLSRYIEG
jgi:hypothetical protein